MREREQLHNNAFKGMMRYISWAGLATSVAIAFMRLYVLDESLSRVACALLFIPVVISSLIGIYKYNNYNIGRWGFFAFFVFVQPWHIWKTGGLLSFGTVWLVVMIPYGALFFSRKVLWGLLIWLSCFILFLAFNQQALSPQYFETPHLIARAFIFICAFFTLFSLVKISMANRDRLREEFVLLEKKQVLADMAINMAHEINNPLAIISLKTELLKRKGVDIEQLEPLQESVDRIHETVAQLKSLSQKEQVEVSPIGDSLN